VTFDKLPFFFFTNLTLLVVGLRVCHELVLDFLDGG